VDARSDIYSLGLVLYELFTGKRAFEAESLAEMLRLRSETSISRPSSHMRNLDPAVERVILRCLEADPAARPANALMVAAALPGGDPLAAALAAGETPSPEMVAAAGETEGMQPRLALLCVTACVLGVIAAVSLIVWSVGLNKMPLEMSREVLEHRARTVVAQLGYEAKPLDSDTDFYYDLDFQRWADQNDQPHAQWQKMLGQQPSMVQFGYRQSPRYMVPNEFQQSNTPGIVTFDDPPTTLSGMVNLELDPSGRMIFFQAIPPQLDKSPPPDKPMDWAPLFTAAGLNASELQPATPEWTSLASSDTRAAWTGTWPGSGRPLRVEAAAWRGKAVYFQMTGPWTRPTRMQPEQQTGGQKAAQILQITLFLVILTGAALLARRQYRQGRGDQQGAFQLARVVFLVQMGIWLFYAHYVPDLDFIEIFVLAVSTALSSAAVVWLLYMALEPYVRRLWPQAIISWTRLISGRIRDPLVGRDVMFGVMLGLTWVIIIIGRILFATSHFYSAPHLPSTDYLLGLRQTLGAILAHVPGGISGTLFFFTILVVLKLLLRNRWAAAAGFVLIFGLLKVLGSHHPGLDGAVTVLVYGIAAFALVRFGLITLGVAVFSANLLLNVPISVDFSRWYASESLLAPLCVLVLGIWGFYTALGGQKLIKGEMLE
jgi:serine/threonine-protein kinase